MVTQVSTAHHFQWLNFHKYIFAGDHVTNS